MASNFFKIAVRSLMRFRTYASVNLIGLALGLTAGIMIMLYAMDELSFDNFHAKASRIYRVESEFISDQDAEGGSAMETNGWGVGHVLRNDFPEVEAVVYMRRTFLMINHGGRAFSERIHFSSPEFFKIFTFPLTKGNPEKALVEPYSVVITEDMEEKYFKGDALNKTLIMADTLQFVVTGVMASIPSNSHIQLDMLISFSTFSTAINPDFNYGSGWGNINMRNYVLLKEGMDAEVFKSKAKNIYKERAPGMLKDWGVQANVVFMPLKDLYLRARNGNGLGPLGNIDRVYLLSAIAMFVILLACINFINLTTARAVYRAKEVGLRLLSGSTRKSLIWQFLSESFVLTLIALIIAIALTGLLMPLFNQLISKDYSLESLGSPSLLLGIAGLVVLVTFLSGYYPALVMSAMRPVEVLKGKMHTGSRGVNLRRVLVIFQFAISVSLVLGTLVVLNQLDHMQMQQLGFAKNEIFVINAVAVRSSNQNVFETFKEQLKSLAVTEEVSYTSSVPGSPGWLGQVSYPEGRAGDAAVSVEYMGSDEDFIRTLGLKVIAGRAFDKQREAELEEGLVLNETAVSRYGWASPEEAIGKKITSPSGYPEGEVIGVVKDYHQFGLQQEIGPIVMDFNPRSSYLYAIRFKAANSQQLISSTRSLWEKHFPAYEFNYFFLDEGFERQYQSEQRIAKVFALFAVITIAIAVIGLLGLVSFMVATRTKEIGVRKVLGADVFQITSLLSKEFLILIVVANIIALPVVWYYANLWLQNFANRYVLDPLIFVTTLLIAIIVALLTISFQTIKAAMTDPVISLRYE